MPDEVVSKAEIKGSQHQIIVGGPPDWLSEHRYTKAQVKANRALEDDFQIEAEFVLILRRARQLKVIRRHPITHEPYRSDEVEILPDWIQIVIVPEGATGKVIPGHGYIIAGVRIVESSGEPDKGQLTVDAGGRIVASKYGTGHRGSGGGRTRTGLGD